MAEQTSVSPSYTRRVLLTVGIVSLAVILLYFFRMVGHVLLLAFAAMLIALVLDGAIRMLSRHAGISRRWSFIAIILFLLLAVVGIGLLVGPQVDDQLNRLSEQLPQAFDKLRGWLEQSRWGRSLVNQFEQTGKAGQSVNSETLGQVSGIFSSFFGAVSSFFIILLLGAYLAFSPKLYVESMVILFPPARRDRMREVIGAQGHALRLWLLARLVSMIFVGGLVGFGLWMIEVPVAISLGIIAGLFTFIPYIGPFLGAIPAILVSFLAGPETALYAAIIYFSVESVESSLITPLVERKVVQVPPAYGILAQLTAGGLFGVLGVVLATPLAVCVAVAVQMLYLQDILGDRVEVLGEGSG